VALTTGTRLGPYEVQSAIGSGGMGEVYRARDTRLDRVVALKLLSPDVATNPERIARFEREARAASALNHPAIVTIYDVGREEAQPWISMELVEGPTLRRLLESGPLPLKRALTLAAQLADGLTKAHEAGIIHRDLKPENVMVSADGFAKILDFGLARLTAVDAPADAATRPGAQTHPGMVMGTLAYMSPEQASGAVVDFRSDQFSFGAVLYEMLTGTHAFARSSSMDTLSAILRDDPPPIGQLNPAIPSPVRWIVERSLEKHAADRYASTRDLARDLARARDYLSELSSSRDQAAGETTRPRGWTTVRELMAWTIAAGLGLAVAALLMRAPTGAQPSERPAVRFALATPDNVAISHDNQPPFELSPDGRRLAVIGSDREGRSGVWVRALDSLAWQRLEGTDGAVDPFWSPDGREIGFSTRQKLLRVPAAGGDVRTICDMPFSSGGTWSRNGVVLFHNQSGLYHVAATGGTPVLLPSDRSIADTLRMWPLFLPDARHFVYVSIGGDDPGIHLGTIDSAEHTQLKPLAMNELTVLGFSDPDYVLFVQNRNLMAQRLDLGKKSLVGDVVRIAEGVDMNAPSSAFSVSTTGAVVYWAGSRALAELTWVDRQGKSAGGIAARGALGNMAISPDGQRLAVERADTNPMSIFSIDLARGGAMSRVAGDFASMSPIWSADGTAVAFSAAREGPPNVYRVRLDGSGGDERLTQSGTLDFPFQWTADGRFLVFGRVDPKTDNDVWLLPLSGDRAARPLLNSRFSEWEGRVSPDGRWLAYVSDESSRDEVYVTRFPNVGERWLVSSGGGYRPIWRRDGRELYYRIDNRIMAVTVGADPAFQHGVPIQLFETSLLPSPLGVVSYDVAPDGRFLLNRIVDRSSAPMTVVTDWRSGLPR
jgi:serine/threonine protein kinase/Tol biopolymer transport system component